jgi:hypothetical protein
MGIRVISYVDDFLFISRSLQEARALMLFAAKEFQDLDWRVHFGKSSSDPSQDIEFLGMGLSSTARSYYAGEKKLASISRLVHRIVSAGRGVRRRVLAGLTGRLISVMAGVRSVRLYTRFLFRSLYDGWKDVHWSRQNWEFM